MRFDQVPSATGHVFRREGKRGPVWYAKYRLPDGRQCQRRIGPAWAHRGRPAAGYFTKQVAQDWLLARLEQERERAVPGGRLGEVTFAEAAREWLRYAAQPCDIEQPTAALSRRVRQQPVLPGLQDPGQVVVPLGWEIRSSSDEMPRTPQERPCRSPSM